jgi:hypothetical protein
MTDLLQCRDDAGAATLSTAKFDVQALRGCGVAGLRGCGSGAATQSFGSDHRQESARAIIEQAQTRSLQVLRAAKAFG